MIQEHFLQVTSIYFSQKNDFNVLLSLFFGMQILTLID